MDFEFDYVPETASASVTTMTASVEPLHMRCPNCLKLYSVEAKLLGSAETSKFECVNCKTAFLALTPALTGQRFLETRPLTSDALEGEPSVVSQGNAELESIFDRQVRSALVSVPMQQQQRRVSNEIELSESAELVAKWENLVTDYQNLSLHESFVNECAKAERLTYAAHKYAQILVVAPQEEIARSMRKRVQGLASFGFDATSRGLSKATWKMPLPSFNSFILLLGSIAAIVGLGLPNAGHTAGLGFAMIALALGLRFFLRRPTH